MPIVKVYPDEDLAQRTQTVFVGGTYGWECINDETDTTSYVSVDGDGYDRAYACGFGAGAEVLGDDTVINSVTVKGANLVGGLDAWLETPAGAASTQVANATSDTPVGAFTVGPLANCPWTGSPWTKADVVGARLRCQVWKYRYYIQARLHWVYLEVDYEGSSAEDVTLPLIASSASVDAPEIVETHPSLPLLSALGSVAAPRFAEWPRLPLLDAAGAVYAPTVSDAITLALLEAVGVVVAPSLVGRGIHDLGWSTIDLSGAAGEYTGAHDAGTSPAFVAVALSGGPSDFDAVVEYGGVALTKIASGRPTWFADGKTRVQVWALIDSVPSGSNTLSVTTDAALTVGRATIYSGATEGAVYIADSGYAGGLYHDGNIVLDSGLDTALGVASFTSSSDSYDEGDTATGVVVDVEAESAVDGVFGYHGHEPAQLSGSRALGGTIGFGAATSGSAALLLAQATHVGPPVASNLGTVFAPALAGEQAVAVPLLDASGVVTAPGLVASLAAELLANLGVVTAPEVADVYTDSDLTVPALVSLGDVSVPAMVADLGLPALDAAGTTLALALASNVSVGLIDASGAVLTPSVSASVTLPSLASLGDVFAIDLIVDVIIPSALQSLGQVFAPEVVHTDWTFEVPAIVTAPIVTAPGLEAVVALLTVDGVGVVLPMVVQRPRHGGVGGSVVAVGRGAVVTGQDRRAGITRRGRGGSVT